MSAALPNGHPERQLSGAAGFDPGHQSGHSCAEACRGAASPMGDPAWLYSVLLVRICYIQPQYEQFSGAIEQSKSENVGNNILCGFYSFISVIHVS